jgi:hypothetical protein
MVETVKYIIPHKFASWKREEIGSGLERNIPIEDEELISFQEDSVKVDLELTTLDNEQRETLEETFSISTNPFQVAIKTEYKYNPSDTPSFEKVKSKVKKYCVFSLILANREIERYYHEYGSWEREEFERSGEGGQGVILPYSFLELSEDGGLNTYYQSDYENLVLANSGNIKWFTKFTSQKISKLEDFLDEFLINGNNVLAESIVNMIIRTHTISSVSRGQFFMNVISMFSCFDELLGQNTRAGIFGNENLLERFMNFRHAIAHPDTHRIEKDGRGYIATKYIDHGNPLRPPEKTKFDIDDLEEVRVRLIDEICDDLNI